MNKVEVQRNDLINNNEVLDVKIDELNIQYDIISNWFKTFNMYKTKMSKLEESLSLQSVYNISNEDNDGNSIFKYSDNSFNFIMKEYSPVNTDTDKHDILINEIEDIISISEIVYTRYFDDNLILKETIVDLNQDIFVLSNYSIFLTSKRNRYSDVLSFITAWDEPDLEQENTNGDFSNTTNVLRSVYGDRRNAYYNNDINWYNASFYVNSVGAVEYSYSHKNRMTNGCNAPFGLVYTSNEYTDDAPLERWYVSPDDIFKPNNYLTHAYPSEYPEIIDTLLVYGYSHNSSTNALYNYFNYSIEPMTLGTLLSFCCHTQNRSYILLDEYTPNEITPAFVPVGSDFDWFRDDYDVITLYFDPTSNFMDVLIEFYGYDNRPGYERTTSMSKYKIEESEVETIMRNIILSFVPSYPKFLPVEAFDAYLTTAPYLQYTSGDIYNRIVNTYTVKDLFGGNLTQLEGGSVVCTNSYNIIKRTSYKINFNYQCKNDKYTPTEIYVYVGNCDGTIQFIKENHKFQFNMTPDAPQTVLNPSTNIINLIETNIGNHSIATIPCEGFRDDFVTNTWIPVEIIFNGELNFQEKMGVMFVTVIQNDDLKPTYLKISDLHIQKYWDIPQYE